MIINSSVLKVLSLLVTAGEPVSNPTAGAVKDGNRNFTHYVSRGGRSYPLPNGDTNVMGNIRPIAKRGKFMNFVDACESGDWVHVSLFLNRIEEVLYVEMEGQHVHNTASNVDPTDGYVAIFTDNDGSKYELRYNDLSGCQQLMAKMAKHDGNIPYFVLWVRKEVIVRFLQAGNASALPSGHVPVTPVANRSAKDDETLAEIRTLEKKLLEVQIQSCTQFDQAGRIVNDLAGVVKNHESRLSNHESRLSHVEEEQSINKSRLSHVEGEQSITNGIVKKLEQEVSDLRKLTPKRPQSSNPKRVRGSTSEEGLTDAEDDFKIHVIKRKKLFAGTPTYDGSNNSAATPGTTSATPTTAGHGLFACAPTASIPSVKKGMFNFVGSARTPAPATPAAGQAPKPSFSSSKPSVGVPFSQSNSSSVAFAAAPATPAAGAPAPVFQFAFNPAGSDPAPTSTPAATLSFSSPPPAGFSFADAATQAPKPSVDVPFSQPNSSNAAFTSPAPDTSADATTSGVTASGATASNFQFNATVSSSDDDGHYTTVLECEGLNRGAVKIFKIQEGKWHPLGGKCRIRIKRDVRSGKCSLEAHTYETLALWLNVALSKEVTFEVRENNNRCYVLFVGLNGVNTNASKSQPDTFQMTFGRKYLEDFMEKMKDVVKIILK